jgi:tight adherence protein B
MEIGQIQAYAAYVTALLSVTLVVYSIPWAKTVSFVRDRWNAKVASVEADLRELHIEGYEANQLVIMAVVLAVVILVGGIFLGYALSSIALATLILVADKLYFPWAQAKLREEFDEKFPMALDQIVSSTRAGLNLAQAMEDVSKLAPHPIDGELQKIVRENRMGSDMATALIAARQRLKSHTLDLTVSALLVNMRQGGDLPKALERMSQALKEIWRLEQKIFTGSAEARKGAMVMSAMPIVIFVMVASMQPEMIDKLTGTLMGLGILVVAAVLYVAGMTWMFKIIKADV